MSLVIVTHCSPLLVVESHLPIQFYVSSISHRVLSFNIFIYSVHLLASHKIFDRLKFIFSRGQGLDSVIVSSQSFSFQRTSFQLITNCSTLE